MMDDESETGSLDQRPGFQTMMSSLVKIDFNYVTNTWIGRLKALELISAALAGCILPSVIGVFYTRYAFYTFVVWTCFMYIFIDLFVHVTSLTRLVPKTVQLSGVLIYFLAIGVMALLISCSLVASVADFSSYRKGIVQTGFSVFFGYMVMILFVIEAILRHQESTKSQSSGECNDDDDDDGDIERRTRISISGPIYKKSNDPPPYSGAGNVDVRGGMAVPIGGYS